MDLISLGRFTISLARHIVFSLFTDLAQSQKCLKDHEVSGVQACSVL